MNDTQVGAYVRLLIKQFDKGGIPESDKRLKSTEVKEKFKKEDDGLYYNSMMESVRDQQNAIKKSASERGKLGAAKVKLKHSNSYGQSEAEPQPSISNKESKVKREIKDPIALLPVDQKVQELENSQTWKIGIAKNQKLSLGFVEAQLTEFLSKESLKEEFKTKHLDDIKDHFINYIFTKKNQAKPNGNHTGIEAN